MRDRLFQSTFRRLFVYNILWEDAEVDERILALNDRSTVLSITGAGCGVAGMLARHPVRIDAVDINRHHLALAALKVSAARQMGAWGDFYDLFARGYTAHPERTIRQVTAGLPPWMQRYWRLHHRRFHRPFHSQGLTGRVMTALRRRVHIDADWLRSMIPMTVAQRERLIDERITPRLQQRHIKTFLNSPVQLLGLGVNYAQRDRMLETEATDLLGFFVRHMKRIAGTDIQKNWFAWYVVAGQLNHDVADAVAPYLRRDRFEAAQESPTTVRFHHTDLFSVMREAGPQTWSHYTLCDAPDWMPAPVQQRLLSEILRTARPGAKVLVRSVEDECMVARNRMSHRLRLMDCSAEATRMDRSCQYRRVALYQVAEA